MAGTDIARPKRMAASVAVTIVGALTWAVHPSLRAEEASLSAAQQKLARVGVPFVPNTGQWDRHAAFAARTLAGTMFVTTDGKLVYHVPGQALAVVSRPARPMATAEQAGPPAPGWSLIESFVDAQGAPLAATPQGAQPATAKVSYFSGREASRHQPGIGTYDRVNLGDVYTGVNVQLRATGSNVEKIFTVAPGQDPRRIHLRLDGATRLEVGRAGELIAQTGNGPITYTAPVAYQEDAEGTRTPVDVRYDVRTASAAAADTSHAAGASDALPATYAFAVGAYDRTRALVIDPLLQSTYLGGAGSDNNIAMLVHPATGEIYVAGATQSSPFPGTTGGADTTFAGGMEAHVSRLSSDLTRLLQTTYLGGSIPSASQEEIAFALAVHVPSGDIYVSGFTTTTDFPGVAGGAQPTYGGGVHDAFVSRLSSDLKFLRQSTYVGSTGDDKGFAIAVHPATGDVYVAGQTDSATGFPQIAGGARGTIGGGIDGFVTRLNGGLTAILQSTYLGGADDDLVVALDIHPASGDVYAGGVSASASFPGTVGGAQPTSGGGSDGFVSRLDRSLTSLVQSTFLGGSADDNVLALAIDPVTGDLFASGSTSSAANTFPSGLPSGGAQPGLAAPDGAYVGRLNPSLTAINRWTFFSGSTGGVFPGKIALHPQSGEVYIVGTTTSPDLPGSADAAQGPTAGQPAFVGRLTADLSGIVQSTYLGTGGENGNAIAIHPGTGEIYVAGIEFAGMNVFPGVAGGAQPASGGGSDGFVSRLSPDLTIHDSIPDHFAFLPQSNVPPNTLRTSNAVQLTGMTPGTNIIGYVTGKPGGELCHTDTPGCCAVPPPSPACDSPAFASGWGPVSGEIFDGDYIQVRHTSQNPAGVADTNLIIGGIATTFRSSTGNAAFACNLDMNGDNKLDALVEGLVLMRAMFGLTGTAVTQGTGVTIPWATLRAQLNAGCGTNFAPSNVAPN